MARPRWNRPEEHDDLLLVADDDDAHRTMVIEHLSSVPGRRRADTLGRYPRFRFVEAIDGDDALRKASPQLTAAAIDLIMPHRNGLEVIQELRARRPDLAILAFTGGAPASEAVAAVMAGADFFHEIREGPEGFERALELAIDRRRLTRLIERSEAEVDAARGRLAQLSGDLARVLPGFKPPQTREDVIPFREAASRYLAACARLFENDARGLAERLGMSYFALRRLFHKYEVPFPGRSRKLGTQRR
jgi:CheY-like chemotaxis protein